LAQPSEKSSDPSLLPDPRLNPLLNPTLGRNLGRWAQVYFTSPPEKRESAVVELLRELEGGPPMAVTKEEPPQSAPVTVPASEAGPALEAVKTSEPLRELIACPSCKEENPASQAFCGACGTALHPASQSSQAHALPAEAAPVPVENELQWLRERVPDSLGEEEPESSRTWKFVVAGVAVALGAFAYLQWSPRPATLPAPTPVVSAPAAVASPQTAQSTESVRPAPADSAPQSPVVESAVARSEDAHQTPVEARLAPRAGGVSSGGHPSGEPAANAGPGGQELKEAQRILGAEGQSRDTAEAAKWLWKAVGKQNPSATVLLADLYLRGDGVPRSCEQARVLLVAAAKKGSSDAAGKLRDVETNCP
jgi:hypothetical protein